MASRVLITGAGGFLGSHLSDLATRMGHHVIEVGRFDGLRVRDHSPRGGAHGMTLPDERLGQLIEREQPDLLIHAAGTASVPHSVQHPYDDFSRNVEVCANVLESLRTKSPATRFLLLSSAAVYGDAQNRPVDELAECNSISPYAYHKRMCELLADEYCKLHGLHTGVARIFSAYGERLRKQVVYDLTERTLTEEAEQLVVHGTGDEARDFLHAEDVAQALLLIGLKGETGVYNVGSGRMTTIGKLAEKIVKLTGSDKAISFTQDEQRGNPNRMWADIVKLNSLGFKPELTLEEGLTRTIQWIAAQQPSTATRQRNRLHGDAPVVRG